MIKLTRRDVIAVANSRANLKNKTQRIIWLIVGVFGMLVESLSAFARVSRLLEVPGQ